MKKFFNYFCLSFLGFIFVQSNFPQQISFQDMANAMGITFPIQYVRGSVSFCDFDGDGKDDLSFSSKDGYPLYIFKNSVTSFADVAASMNLSEQFDTKNLLWCDYDNDGDMDLFTAVDGETTYSRLYRNDGNNNFEDVTIEAGLSTEPTSCNAACWGDFNNDGWIDLYVTNYSEYSPNYLYKNNGDGTFTDVTIQAGVADSDDTPGFFKLPWAVVFFDYNNDDWQDIYIANDHYTGNTLFRNNGDGTFTNVNDESGAGVTGFMMGLAVGDYNDDGFLDIYVSNDPMGNKLLKNNGDGTFTDVADQLGLAVNKSCWGNNFFDFDNDGDLDLYVCVEAGSPNSWNPLFRNNGDGTFTEIHGIGLDFNNVSFGCAVGDYNNDGFYDIAVHNEQSYPNLFRNSSNNNKWIKIKLKGVECNRDGVGSKIEAYFNGKKVLRQTQCGISYMSQNCDATIIGVNNAGIVDSVIIKWAGSGNIDILRNLPVDTTITVTEGETVTDVKNSTVNPVEFELEQNYPNPFNPSTTIEYKLSKSSFVNLTIYDALGKETAVLINENKSPGIYKVNFNAENLTSGIYFYKFKTDNFTQIKKMILLK